MRDHNHRSGLRSALYLPIFDALADPAVVARLAAEAEETGLLIALPAAVVALVPLGGRQPIEGVRDARSASAHGVVVSTIHGDLLWCDVGWPRPASAGVPDRDRWTEDRRTDAKRAHNRPPTRNSGHLPVRP